MFLATPCFGRCHMLLRSMPHCSAMPATLTEISHAFDWMRAGDVIFTGTPVRSAWIDGSEPSIAASIDDTIVDVCGSTTPY